MSSFFMFSATFCMVLFCGVFSQGTTVEKVKYSHKRGFYDAQFELTLSTTSSFAIRYTLDGSFPTASTGILYAGPIQVASTVIVKALAYDDTGTLSPSKISSHTFLFGLTVLDQASDGIPTGFLSGPFNVGKGAEAADDYKISKIQGEQNMVASMKSIPSLSLSMSISDFKDIYEDKNDQKNEKSALVSIELIDSSVLVDNSHTLGVISAHSDLELKRSLKLSFVSTVSEGKWETNLLAVAPLNGRKAATKLETVILRAGNNRAWTRVHNPDRTAFIRDEFYRATQIASSGFGARGTFAHLLVNGIYMGIYNAAERPDEKFSSLYFGGSSDEWFSINHGENKPEDAQWNSIMSSLAADDAVQKLKSYLDINSFIDYILINFYIGMGDWPENNWWAGKRVDTPTEINKLRFYAWDGEVSFDTTAGNDNAASDHARIHPAFWSNITVPEKNSPISQFFHVLRKDQNFLSLLADRAFKLALQGGGALTDEQALYRWDALAGFISPAIGMESGRWGDALFSLDNTVRSFSHWETEKNRVKQLITGNGNRLIEALKKEGYYPVGGVMPVMAPAGGKLAPGQKLHLSIAKPGLICWNFDRDPLDLAKNIDLDNGAQCVEAQSVEISITWWNRVLVRSFVDETWSPLNEEEFWHEQHFVKNLAITELMFHARDSTTGANDGDEFDFLEIKNVGTRRLRLQDVSFAGAVDFRFDDFDKEHHFLDPGAFFLLVEDKSSFYSRYPALDVKPRIVKLGSWSGKLSNSGEMITVMDGDTAAFSWTYKDVYPWDSEKAIDGGGRSIVPVFANGVKGEYNSDDSWSMSANLDGSPGKDDPSSEIGTSTTDEDTEVTEATTATTGPTTGVTGPTTGVTCPTTGVTNPTTGATPPTPGATPPTTGATFPTTGVSMPTTGVSPPTTGATTPTTAIPTTGVSSPPPPTTREDPFVVGSSTVLLCTALPLVTIALLWL